MHHPDDDCKITLNVETNLLFPVSIDVIDISSDDEEEAHQKRTDGSVEKRQTEKRPTEAAMPVKKTG